MRRESQALERVFMAGTDVHSRSALKLLCKPEVLVKQTGRTQKTLGKEVMAIYTLLISEKAKQMSMRAEKASFTVLSFCLESRKVLLLWCYLPQLMW